MLNGRVRGGEAIGHADSENTTFDQRYHDLAPGETGNRL
jgi:hypothetical protein